MRKIALYGGSFNPVHKGHVNLVLSQNEIEQFDKIIIVPSNISVHKSNSDIVDIEHRLRMCKICFGKTNIKIPIEVSDIEHRLGGKSYTIETLLELKKIYKDSIIYLIIGSDMLYSFEKWYRHKEILNLSKVLVGARNFFEYKNLIKYSLKFNKYGNIKVNKGNIIDISSTKIRNIIFETKVKDELFERLSSYLEVEVINYIIKNNLYYNI